MRTRIIMIAALMTVAMFSATAIASWMPLSLRERARQSDAIVVVTITNVQHLANGVYRNVAFARVEQSLKGSRLGESIKLPFGNDQAAVGSDPEYAIGEHCLLFLRLLSPGEYTVLQSVFDKHLIKNGTVEDTDGRNGMQLVPLSNIVNQVSALLVETKPSAQPTAGGDGKPAPQP
jgi:hypothetical protein